VGPIQRGAITYCSTVKYSASYKLYSTVHPTYCTMFSVLKEVITCRRSPPSAATGTHYHSGSLH